MTATVTIDPAAATQRHSTGLYAAPGELIEVTVPGVAIAGEFFLQIGGHSVSLPLGDTWRRMPRVTRSFGLDAATVEVASPFGGAIYVDVGKSPLVTTSFALGIDGAVEAPMFVVGETDVGNWLATIRDLPGPQAELVSDHIIFSVPSDAIRLLDDPDAVLNHWDDLVAEYDDLAGHASMRTTPHRVDAEPARPGSPAAPDYPIDAGATFLEPSLDSDTLLTSGAPRMYRVLAHMAADRPDGSWETGNPWIFNGSRRAAEDLFVTRTFDLGAHPDRGDLYWTASPIDVMRRALEVTPVGDYTALDDSLKSPMFQQLRDGWGWSAWQDLLAG